MRELLTLKYILKKAKDRGENFLEYFKENEMASNELGTAVHEETHGYIFYEYYGKYGLSGLGGESIYIGNKKKIDIHYTKVFKSKKMAKSIPKRLRTFRYKTYIGSPIPNLGSNANGAYGILDEFTAYYWEMHTIMSLKPYFEKTARSPEDWEVYINAGANGRQAYAEFRYYTLHYLYYAKKNYPKIYKGIVKNKNYVKAFNTMDKKFSKQNREYEKQLRQLVNYYNAQEGVESKIEKDSIWFMFEEDEEVSTGYGYGIMQKDYAKLMKEMKTSKYKPILKDLKNKVVK